MLVHFHLSESISSGQYTVKGYKSTIATNPVRWAARLIAITSREKAEVDILTSYSIRINGVPWIGSLDDGIRPGRKARA